MITRPAGDARLAVSLPPSCQKLFDAIGVSGAVARGPFIRSTGHTVWWGSAERRVEPFASGALGWQADVQALGEILLADAVAAGATVERGTATEASVSEASDRGQWLIDATGRAGVLAKARGLRTYDAGPRTVALVAEWRSDSAWPVPDDSHTLIESYDGGWVWSVPLAGHPACEPSSPQAPKPLRHPSLTRHIAAMVDPLRTGLARGATAREVYLTEIGKTRAFASITAHATLAGGPWGWDASTYSARQYAGEGWLLVGDAGSFLDPLSSAGVKKALAAGWLAAVTVHTCLVRPEMRSHAVGFFSAREQEVEQHHARMSRHFLAEAASRHPHAFWADRSAEADEPTELAEQAAVRAALAGLRSASAFDARPGPDVRIEPRAAVSGREIVLEPHIITAESPAGVRYIRGTDLVVLVDLAPHSSQVPDLFEAYCRRADPVPLPDFLFALATAVARGWVVAQ